MRHISPYDLDHLTSEIELIELFRKRFPDLPQVACLTRHFTVTCRGLSRHCRSLATSKRRGSGATVFMACPICVDGSARPHRGREGGPGSRDLGPPRRWCESGGGAWREEYQYGRGIYSSFGYAGEHPFGGSGPGLVRYLAKTERIAAKVFNEMVKLKSGLLGISEIRSGMQELLRQ